jgi:hypothetical protein
MRRRQAGVSRETARAVARSLGKAKPRDPGVSGAAPKTPDPAVSGPGPKKADPAISCDPHKTPDSAFSGESPENAEAISGPETAPGKTGLDIAAAWDAAPLAERTRGLNNIGLRALLDALPADWRPEITASRPLVAPLVGNDPGEMPDFLRRVPADSGEELIARATTELPQLLKKYEAALTLTGEQRAQLIKACRQFHCEWTALVLKLERQQPLVA